MNMPMLKTAVPLFQKALNRQPTAPDYKGEDK
jgi:hypothetical protein